MKKFITLLTTAIFFSICCSLIDQFIWHNEFTWACVVLGFVTGSLLVLLCEEKSHRTPI